MTLEWTQRVIKGTATRGCWIYSSAYCCPRWLPWQSAPWWWDPWSWCRWWWAPWWRAASRRRGWSTTRGRTPRRNQVIWFLSKPSAFSKSLLQFADFQTSRILLDSFLSNLLTDDVGTVFTQMSSSVWDVLAIKYNPQHWRTLVKCFDTESVPLPEFSFKSKSW